jgi:hypothetical protein
VDRLPADRRALWHDPLTNEQWFGLLAQDSQSAVDSTPTHLDRAGTELTLRHDPAWVTLSLRPPTEPSGPLTIAFDVVPGGPGTLPDGTADATSDYAVTLDPAAQAGQVHVRRALDPVPLDFSAAGCPTVGPAHGYRHS